MSRKLFVLLFIAAIASASYGAHLLASWEGTPDNSIDWGNKLSVDDPCNMPVQVTGNAGYNYSTVGVTEGSQSLEVSQSGWAQSLTIRLDAAAKAAFMTTEHVFEIDMSVRAYDDYDPIITGGYTQIYEVAMNAPGAGFQGVATGTPLNFYWWEGSGARTATLSVNYRAFRALITETSYIEIIFALNTGGGAPPEMYFDNARLTPEPATLALLGLGGLLLRRRR